MTEVLRNKILASMTILRFSFFSKLLLFSLYFSHSHAIAGNLFYESSVCSLFFNKNVLFFEVYMFVKRILTFIFL